MINIPKTLEIRKRVPISAQYEQLAEECSELAHAALKVARICRNENPTPVKTEDAVRSVFEEFNDIMSVANVIGLDADELAIEGKLDRWYNRLEGINND
jgi:NTP pyrophosphatase (non-canonical NTP hydrolase)